MFKIGDIVRIYAPIAGKQKYHLCVCVGEGSAASQFVFMNSDDDFDGVYAVECARVPCLPPSRTGKTVFSFNDLPRYNARQLALYNATRMGDLAADVASELIEFVKKTEVLNRADRATILAALVLIAKSSS